MLTKLINKSAVCSHSVNFLAIMAAELLNTVSIASLSYLGFIVIVSYLVALLIGRKVSLVDRLVLWWLIFDGLIHLTLVCDRLFQ